MSGRAAIYNHMNLNRFLLDSAFALWLPEPGPNAAKSSVSSDKTVGSERPKLHSDSADQHWPGTVSFGWEIFADGTHSSIPYAPHPSNPNFPSLDLLGRWLPPRIDADVMNRPRTVAAASYRDRIVYIWFADSRRVA